MTIETRIRYVVATTVPEHPTAREAQPVREVLRGRGHAIASAFAAYFGHNHYRRVRLRSAPVTVLAERGSLTTGRAIFMGRWHRRWTIPWYW